MEAILYITAKVISLSLSAISFAMSARVIMQIISQITSHDLQENKVYIFCYALTEIFVAPFRFMCDRLNLFVGTPIDAPFFIAYISITLINMFLPII